MKKRLILILNGKGGVGKSFFAVNFVQYLKDHQITHAAFDSDDENSTLKRFHSEVQFIDAGQPTEIDKMTYALTDYDVVVVDCRAASTRIFLNYFEETQLPTVLESLDARLTIACPVNHEMDSIYQIQRLVSAIGGKVDFVIIRNEVHGEGFDLFDKSKLRQKMLSDLGAKEIQVRQMQKWLVEDLQKSKLTVTAARANQDFHLLDRQRLKLWQEKFYAQIEIVKNLLLPADAAQVKG
jgi:MinD-like ATPase involved in chromosome partitioning or flagellar assembly